VTISRSPSTLAKPSGDEPVKLGTLGYFRARNRGRVHDLVLSEFGRSGISKATLARRLKKRPEIITRLLSGPGNWTMDTFSDLLFAISGAEAEYEVGRPLDAAPRNYTHPEWLIREEDQPDSQGSARRQGSRELERVEPLKRPPPKLEEKSLLGAFGP